MHTIDSNTVAAVFLFIVLIGTIGAARDLSGRLWPYRLCVVVCLIGLISDGLSYALDETGVADFMGGVVEYLSYIAIDVMIVSYAIYLSGMIREKEESFGYGFVYCIAGLCAVDIIVLTVGTITGKLFYIQGGHVFDGDWENFIIVLPALCVLGMLVLLGVKVKVLERRTAVVLGVFLVLSAVPAVLNMFFEDAVSSYLGPAAALMAVYVVIQSRTIAEANIRVDMYNTLSTLDVLTGLKNRRGYDEYAGKLQAGTGVGVVFCDINSLKTVNDRYGHEAGDRLIVRMSEILKKAFPDDEIFRISGDEFVVIEENPDAAGFAEKTGAFAGEIAANGRIGAFGASSGDAASLREITKAAEEGMYDDKDRYYAEMKRDRRR